MEGQEIKITMDHILKTFEAAKDEKRPKDIKSAIIASLNQDGSLFANQEINFNDIDKSVDKLLASDKKSGRDSFLIYNKGKYKKREGSVEPSLFLFIRERLYPTLVPAGRSSRLGFAAADRPTARWLHLQELHISFFAPSLLAAIACCRITVAHQGFHQRCQLGIGIVLLGACVGFHTVAHGVAYRSFPVINR